jgi:hypothetical protein
VAELETIMSSPWKKEQEPEVVVVDKVLRRAELGKVNALVTSPVILYLIKVFAHRLAVSSKLDWHSHSSKPLEVGKI